MQAERPDAEEIPIIALSANAFAEDVQTSLDAGMNGHVSKPLNVAEVAKVIILMFFLIIVAFAKNSKANLSKLPSSPEIPCKILENLCHFRHFMV